MNDFMRDIDAGTHFVEGDTAQILRAVKNHALPPRQTWRPVAMLKALPRGIRQAVPLLAATTVAATVTFSASMALTHRNQGGGKPATSAKAPFVAPVSSSPRATFTPTATPGAVSSTSPNPRGVPPPAAATSSSAPTPAPSVAPPANSTYVASVLNTAGLVSFWRLGETAGTSAADSKGSNSGAYQSGTTLGVPGLVPNDSQTAIQTGTSAGGVFIPNSTSLNPTTQISVEAWIKPTASEAGEIFVDKSASYRLRFDSTGRLSFGVYINGTERQVLSPGGLPLNAVSHVVGTYDGSILNLYVNGALVNSISASGAISVTSAGVGIGYNGGSMLHFGGSIQDVALYDVALTAQQVSRS